MTEKLVAIGAEHIGIADTIGVGTPIKVQKRWMLPCVILIDNISGHFHDTYGQALSNTLAALQMGYGSLIPWWQGFGLSMPKAQLAMLPPKMWYICYMAWVLKRALTSTNWSMSDKNQRVFGQAKRLKGGNKF